jgi:hypothetical protein
MGVWSDSGGGGKGGGVTGIFQTFFGLGIWDVSSLANILGPSLLKYEKTDK